MGKPLDTRASDTYRHALKLSRIVDELTLFVEKYSDEPDVVGHIDWAILQLRIATDRLFELAKARRKT
jgi:hypothetical protein